MWPVADAIGHCVLVFAFVPTLVALPEWLWVEVTNPLNLHDPVVLAFALVRGCNILLDSFAAGVVPGLVAGVVDGILVSAWVLTQDRVSTTPRRLALGAVAGAVAGAAAVLVVIAREALRTGHLAVPTVLILFGIASGVVCGVLAAPTAVRLLTVNERHPERGGNAGGSMSASQ